MIQALGFSVVLVGLKMALFVTDLIVTIGCLLVGAITGELIRIEYWIARLGKWMRVRFKSNSSTFAEGFMSASILYLTGAMMMIVGSIQDGTVGNSTTLYVKSLLDGVISIPLASTFGIGVAFSAIPVFLVQGSVTLLASHLLFMQDPDVLNAVTATGGLLIVWIAYRRDRHEPFENNKNTYREFSARNLLCHCVGGIHVKGRMNGDRLNRSAEFR